MVGEFERDVLQPFRDQPEQVKFPSPGAERELGRDRVLVVKATPGMRAATTSRPQLVHRASVTLAATTTELVRWQVLLRASCAPVRTPNERS